MLKLSDIKVTTTFYDLGPNYSANVKNNDGKLRITAGSGAGVELVATLSMSEQEALYLALKDNLGLE